MSAQASDASAGATVDRRAARLQQGITAALALGAYVLDSKLIFVLAAASAIAAVALGTTKSPGAMLFDRVAAKQLGGEQPEPASRFRVGEIVVAALISADFKRFGLALIQIGALICLLGLIADVHLGALKELRRHHIVAADQARHNDDPDGGGRGIVVNSTDGDSADEQPADAAAGVGEPISD
jgi:hypothetical protein